MQTNKASETKTRSPDKGKPQLQTTLVISPNNDEKNLQIYRSAEERLNRKPGWQAGKQNVRKARRS